MMLELKNIFAGYTEGNPILKGVDLTISENDVVAVIGQNGSGKSTLAKSIMNLVPHIEGNILFEGQSINKKSTSEIAKLGIGFFIQGGSIFPNLTTQENLDFASINLKSYEKGKREKEIKEYFELFRNASRAELKASYLSGGEQHQLALAMLVVNKPKLLILDEPSAGLSPKNVQNLYLSLEKIKKNEKQSILLIEQNIRSALGFCERILVLQLGKLNKEIPFQDFDNYNQIEAFLLGSLN